MLMVYFLFLFFFLQKRVVAVNMSHVTCNVSLVTCHMSRVTCHVSHVTIFLPGQSVEAIAGGPVIIIATRMTSLKAM